MYQALTHAAAEVKVLIQDNEGSTFSTPKTLQNLSLTSLLKK